MQKLKEAYEIKKQLVTSDMNKLGNILKEDSNIETVDVNSDNTIYVESNCGIDSIKNSLDKGITRILCIDEYNIIRKFIFNALPLSGNSCIIRI